MGWGELKNIVFEELDQRLTPMCEHYEQLMDPGSQLDAVLVEGAVKARDRATPVLKAARNAIGI